ncbi:MAG: CBS domain-containing protein [Rhodoferax sp.]|nr:CBS domain-containing protein [Rhodoferax sp.]MCB2030468.1 CBS domain-containing protein [Rhodoferax sp.]MCP5262487.1 CBS domain-containing protein [Rhodoferax sp.]
MPRHLNDIATTIVAVVEAETTALQTAQLMRRHHVGALVVVDAHEKTRPIGIVTDRDLVLAVMAEGLDPAVFTASDIMSGELVVARASLELQDGVALMHERKVRRLVIVDDAGRLRGIMTLEDVLEAMSDDLKALVSGLRGARDREFAQRR